jgi:hypothetical protein
MIYIKDLIDIRDHVGRGDFVLRLSEGVRDPEGTVEHYTHESAHVRCKLNFPIHVGFRESFK